MSNAKKVLTVVAMSDLSSSTTSSSGRPRSPPFSFVRFTQSWKARCRFCESTALAPLSDTERPILIGACA